MGCIVKSIVVTITQQRHVLHTHTHVHTHTHTHTHFNSVFNPHVKISRWLLLTQSIPFSPVTFGMTSSTMFYFTHTLSQLFLDSEFSGTATNTFRGMTTMDDFWRVGAAVRVHCCIIVALMIRSSFRLELPCGSLENKSLVLVTQCTDAKTSCHCFTLFQLHLAWPVQPCTITQRWWANCSWMDSLKTQKTPSAEWQQCTTSGG